MATTFTLQLSIAVSAVLAAAWLTLAGADVAQANGADDMQQGMEAIRRDDPPGAIAALTRAIESGELSQEQLEFALEERARGYILTNQNSPAFSDVARLLALDPGNSAALILRAEIETRTRRFDAAMADLDKAIEDGQPSKDDRVSAYVVRGVIWNERGEYGRALAAFELAIELDGDAAAARGGRAVALRGLGRFDEAIRDFDELMKQEPDDPFLRLQRGTTYYVKRDFKRAIEDADEALARGADPNLGRALRAVVYYNLRQIQEAIRDLDVVVTAREQDYELALWRYFALLRAGDTARAEAELDRHAIRSVETSPTTRWPQVVYEYFTGKADNADVQFGAAHAAADERQRKRLTCEADFYVGEFAALRGQAAMAREVLGQAMRDCPVNADEHVAAETTLAQLGN